MLVMRHTPTPSRCAGHLSPSKGERNPGWKSAGADEVHFLSPGQGERWPAKRDGVGVLCGQLFAGSYLSTTCSIAPKIEWPDLSFISIRTVSPKRMKGVVALPVSIVSMVRISAMQE